MRDRERERERGGGGEASACFNAPENRLIRGHFGNFRRDGTGPKLSNFEPVQIEVTQIKPCKDLAIYSIEPKEH